MESTCGGLSRLSLPQQYSQPRGYMRSCTHRFPERYVHRVSLWSWCCLTSCYSSFLEARRGVKKRIEDALREHQILRDTCRQFWTEWSVVWDDVKKSARRCAEEMPVSCCTCESGGDSPVPLAMKHMRWSHGQRWRESTTQFFFCVVRWAALPIDMCSNKDAGRC